MSPATAVPCMSMEEASLPSGWPVTKFQWLVFAVFACRSGWASSMPSSATPTVMPSPRVTGQAARTLRSKPTGAAVFGSRSSRCHWSGKNGSFGMGAYGPCNRRARRRTGWLTSTPGNCASRAASRTAVSASGAVRTNRFDRIVFSSLSRLSATRAGSLSGAVRRSTTRLPNWMTFVGPRSGRARTQAGWAAEVPAVGGSSRRYAVVRGSRNSNRAASAPRAPAARPVSVNHPIRQRNIIAREDRVIGSSVTVRRAAHEDES